MSYNIRKRALRPGRLMLLVFMGFIMCALFFVLYSTRACADGGDKNAIRGYEQVLIRPGDTLDMLSRTYAGKYSYLSVDEYRTRIVELNGLTSDYLREGIYLMLPICRISPLP